MSLIAPPLPSKENVAHRLAQSHFSIEPGMTQIFRIKCSSNTEEVDPFEPVKLLEVNSNTVESGIRPIHFGAHPAAGMLYPSVIIEITPAELAALSQGGLRLPNGWLLDREIQRS